MSYFTGRETLVERKGQWFIRYETDRYNEPIMDVIYWPVAGQRGHRMENLPLPAKHEGEGVYTVRNSADLNKPMLGYDAFFTVYLKDRGRTQADPELTESHPIPAPKCRLDTRYRYGKWEKYSKRQGWVAA